MDRLLILIVAALATWRLAVWLWYENGAMPVRAFLCRWPWTACQVSCFWCVTFWVAWPVAALAWWCWPVLVPFALSGAAMLLSGGGRVVWREMTNG